MVKLAYHILFPFRKILYGRAFNQLLFLHRDNYTNHIIIPLKKGIMLLTQALALSVCLSVCVCVCVCVCLSVSTIVARWLDTVLREDTTRDNNSEP